MLLSRAFDRKAIAQHRQGAWGMYLEVFGQEAAVVGSALAVDPARDWLVGQARELPAYLHHGWPIEGLAALFLGKFPAARIPDGVRMLPLQIAIGAQLPHAVGLAWGLRRQRTDSVVICYFGEGASSEGDFHEACNLAGVVRAPVVMFMQNNQWAISTPSRDQTAAGSYAVRADGYGFPGVQVDGNDLFAVHQVTTAAVARARAGAGPTLIEAITYRMGAHNTSDNASKYADPAELDEARSRDPIDRVERYLSALGLWDPVRRSRAEARAKEAIEQAVEAARSLPAPSPAEAFEHVYGTVPERVLRQRRELLDSL